MENIAVFFKMNLIPIIATLVGILMGYLHWFFWGCYWGTYPLSSECWVNCSYGGLFFGYIVLAISNNNQKRNN